MYTPHPGELNTPIDIYTTVNALNENGYPEESDTLVCHVRADVKDASSKYARAADTDVSELGLSFIIRWRSDVKVGMYVLWKGEKQNIETIGEFDHCHTYMELFTRSVTGVKQRLYSENRTGCA